MKRISKSIVMFLSIIVFIVCFAACGLKKQDEKVHEDVRNKNDEISYEYKSLSSISSLACNETICYSTEYTDVELYDWGGDIVLPIPKPEGAKKEISIERMLTFSGVNKEEWERYTKKLQEQYIIIDYDEITDVGDELLTSSITITDKDSNFYVLIGWDNIMDRYKNIEKMEGVIYIHCFLGNQEKNSSLTKSDVKRQILDELKIEGDIENEFFVFDVSSRTNLKDGFDVYYLMTPKEYRLNEERIYMYLCVIQNESIVYLEPNVVTFGSNNNEVEFVNRNNIWEMYVLAYEIDRDISMSSQGVQLIDKCVLKDEYFEYQETYYVYEIEGCENKEVTFEKKGDTLELYEVIRYKDSNKAYYEMCSVGDEMGVLE